MMKCVDLFAGLGGISFGARQAGVRCVWASNHSPAACEAFERNHGVKPVCKHWELVDWAALPYHNILLAGPSCTGHTPARGKDKPHSDVARGTAWGVVDALEANCTEIGVIENVPHFLRWRLYPAWAAAMKALGYALAPHIVDAADFGVPQNRRRVFVVATRSRNPLWLKLPRRRHRPAGEVIDWSSKVKWSSCDDVCENTRIRIANGRAAFGPRFVAPYYGSGSGLTGRSLDRPIGTIPTHDRWLVVDGARKRMLNVQEIRAFMGFPEDCWLPENDTVAKHLLGNAVPPRVACDIITAIKEAA